MGVKFAVVGCGRIGSRHLEHIANYAELAAVCDINENKAAEFGKKYSVPHFNDLEKLLTTETDVDVVSVCTPNGLHARHSILALQHEKHVLCEKPMALSAKDGWLMVNEAERAGKQLFIVKQNRFNPPVQKVKEVIDSGMLGNIYSAQVNCFWNRNERYYSESDWKGSRNLDGGILFTQFSHFIDLMYWFLGDVRRVFSVSGKFHHKDLLEFEDTIISTIEFHSGALATLNCTINCHQKNMEGSITIFAEKGTIKIGGQYLNVLEYQNIEDHVIEEIESHRPANDYGYYQGSMSNHDKVILNVVDVLQNNGRIATSGYEGIKTVEIIENIYSNNYQSHQNEGVNGNGHNKVASSTPINIANY